MDEEIFDSTTGWVAEHIRAHVESDSAKGHLHQGRPTLLITTRGRKSGELRRTAPGVRGVGGDHAVVGDRTLAI